MMLQSSDSLPTIFPYIVIWNPLMKFPEDLPDVCMQDGCTWKILMKHWRMGQSHGMEPRLLHCVENIVVLISPMYQCEYGHSLSATDPQLLAKLSPAYIPFVLLHRTGFTRHFINTVVLLFREGVTIQGIERHIQRMRQQHTSSIIIQHINKMPKNLQSSTADSLDKSEELTSIKLPFPSNNLIYHCILVHFMERKNFYNSEMDSIPISSYLSIDHTFKIASNIGYRRSDGKWVTLYNSLFIVLNELGQVVMWQFTNSTSFDEVTPMLTYLKTRIQQPISIYVDNCCQQRSKLLQIFGPNIQVYLDIFHAVQRVTKVIPKRHPLYSTCVNDLKMVFRSPGDIGQQRQSLTPDSAQLLKNMDDFVKKWYHCEYNGWKLFNNNLKLQ